jgi:outer membrane protein assembly factor BamB
MLRVCVAVALGLLQQVTAQSWCTYHGDYALTGVLGQAFSDKPARRWRTRVGEGLPSAVVGGHGRLFCISDGATIMALDVNGAILWTRVIASPAASVAGASTDECFTAPPLYIPNKLLVVAADSGMVYGLSLEDGSTCWTYETGASIQGSPNVSAGTGTGDPDRVLVITNQEGVLHAVNAADGSKLWESEPLERTDGHVAVSSQHAWVGNCSAALIAVNLANGKRSAVIDVGPECQMAGGVAASKGQVFAGTRSGSLAAADVMKGSLLWLNDDSAGELFFTPAVTDRYVVFQGGDSALYCVDRASGVQVWSREVVGSLPLSPVVAGDLVLASIDGVVSGFSLTSGDAQWRLEIGDEISAPAIIGNMIVVGVDDGYVTAYGKEENK